MITLHDYYWSYLFVWADNLMAAHILVNAIDLDIHGPLFLATDFKRSNCVHLLLGALQRLDHESHISSPKHQWTNLFIFT